MKFVFCQNPYSEYIIRDSINGFVFKATGKLFADKKKHSNFTLSQYENLLKSSNDLFNEEDSYIAGDEKICYDNKEYFSDYKSMKSKSLLFENDCDSKRLVVEKINIPKWTIDSTSLIMNKHSVLKAEAIINDRKWIVYYNPKIKALANPWYFYGIKGLIIRAFDEKRRYSFELTKFENKISPTRLKAPSNYIKCSFAEYKKLTVKEHAKSILEDIEKIAIDQDAVEKFKSKMPPYECLDFIEKK